jgi:hypothetical protein
MAQTGYTPILIYSSTTAAQAPSAGNLTNSTLGSELAINITDGKLFYKDNANAVQVIAWKTTPTTAGGTGLTSYTAGDMLYYASGTALSKLAIGTTGQWLGSSGTAPQWNSPAALTKTDDTNVTLTLGGSASTALLNAASLTLGWTGTLAVSRGGTGTGTAFTAGSVIFAGTSGVYSQDNTNFFWDDSNNRLGLGIATPTDRLHVYGGLAKVESTVGGSTSAYFYQISPAFTGGSQTKSAYVMETGTRITDLGFFTNSGGQYGTYLNLGGASQDAGFELQFAGSVKQTWFPSGGVSIGNTTDPGAGSLGVNGNIFIASAQNGIQGGGVYTYAADVSSPTFNVFYNAFQLPTPINNRPHAYLVTAILANNTTTYNACSIVYQGHSGGVYYATIINLSSNDVSLGLSATNVANPYVQVRDNSSGGAQVLRVSAVLITPF